MKLRAKEKAWWRPVPTRGLPGRLALAERAFQQNGSGALLVLLAGWSDDNLQKRVWWELHYGNSSRQYNVVDPPTEWADNIIKRLS